MSDTLERPIGILGFDFGTRQVGVAYGQTLSLSARPVAVLQAREGQPQWPQVLHLIEEWQPARLVVGLPLNMDGTESEFCLRARKFARRLRARAALPVAMVDERLSTRTAKSMAGPSADYRRRPVDSLAAVLILETWLADPDVAVEP